MFSITRQLNAWWWKSLCSSTRALKTSHGQQSPAGHHWGPWLWGKVSTTCLQFNSWRWAGALVTLPTEFQNFPRRGTDGRVAQDRTSVAVLSCSSNRRTLWSQDSDFSKRRRLGRGEQWEGRSCASRWHALPTSKCQSDLTNDYSATSHPSGRVECLLGGEWAQRELKQLDERPCGESTVEKTTLVTLTITNLTACGNRPGSVLRTQLTLTQGLGTETQRREYQAKKWGLRWKY